MIKIPVPASTTMADLNEADITGFLAWESSGQFLVLNDGVTSEQIAAAHEFATNPTLAIRRTISDKWAIAAAKVNGLPPVPESGPDTYATIRTRLTAERDALKSQADDLGGLV